MQVLLTAGLAHEKSSRATNMVYTQILFALAFDKLIFNTTPGGWSIVGSSLVLGSALYITVHKDNTQKKTPNGKADGSEEVGLMASNEEEDDDDGASSSRRSRGEPREIQLRNMRSQGT